jgi:hypothetical protein
MLKSTGWYKKAFSIVSLRHPMELIALVSSLSPVRPVAASSPSNADPPLRPMTLTATFQQQCCELLRHQLVAVQRVCLVAGAAGSEDGLDIFGEHIPTSDTVPVSGTSAVVCNVCADALPSRPDRECTQPCVHSLLAQQVCLATAVDAGAASSPFPDTVPDPLPSPTEHVSFDELWNATTW